VSIHQIAARPSGVSRGFTIIEVKKTTQNGSELPAQSDSTAKG
jgi:hypothetical protein